MSVLLDRTNVVLIQGITGKIGRFSARDLLDYGTRVVAGSSPGRTGTEVEGIPVFPGVQAAVHETGADTALVYVPAEAALDAVLEAIECGCRLVAYPGDGLPVSDAIELRAAARANGAVLIGPNSPGIISPGKAKLGFMPSACYRPGPFGVISRSGSLSYEVCYRMTRAGFGQTTVIGIGGDPVKGLGASEAAERLHADPETKAILYLGEIGGSDEYRIAEYARRRDAKPVAALVVGRAAPPGRKMGHAAALIGSASDSHEAKIAALRKAGVATAETLTALIPVVEARLGHLADPERLATGQLATGQSDPTASVGAAVRSA